MTLDIKNNQLWIQHTPGASGKLITMCCTTSTAVGNWENTLTDPVSFTTNHFCNPDSGKHLLGEPMTPYKVGWYTRDQLFTRGDDLTPRQVREHLMQDPVATEHLNKGLLIANVYNKTYVPSWCEKIVTIYNDSKSIDWILNRRKNILYEWHKDKVYMRRYMSTGSPVNQSIAKLYNPIQYEYTYTNADEFVLQEFEKENVQKGPGLNIALSDILYNSADKICSQLNDYLPEPVDNQWCIPAIETWKKRWVL